MRGNVRTGLLILGIAGVLWLAGLAAYGATAIEWLGVILVGVGYLAAYRADKPAWRWTAAAGIGLFLLSALMGGPRWGLGLTANLSFLAGTVLLAAGMGQQRLERWGGALAALGGLLWVISDLQAGGNWWMPGNVVSVLGGASLALPRR